MKTNPILKSLLFIAIVLVGPAHSATITVDGTDGVIAADGVCSISEAIQAANTDAVVNECDAGSVGLDTIILSTNITLTTVFEEDATYGSTGTPAISSSIIINGMGFIVARQSELICNYDFNNDAEEFRLIRTTPSADLTLNNLTMSKGCADGGLIDGSGAAIHNQGHLTIESTVISFNTTIARGAGIFNSGTISAIDNITLLTNSAGYLGGGIYNEGTINTIQNSTFSDNYVDDGLGGGIYNNGTITTIQNSTFSDNSADNGGGILNSGTTITTIQNTTFSGNTAEDGAGVSSSSLIGTMQNNTFSGNLASSTGKAIKNTGTIEYLRNSLFHTNTTSGSADECELDGSGAITNSNSNMTDDLLSNCPGTSTTLTSNSVAPLADNGGPTMTHALLPGGEAIDAGNGDSTTADQRGFTATNTRDIGAFEAFVPVITAPADVLQFEATGVLTSPPLGSAIVSDVDEDELDLIITNSQSSDFPIGLTTVTWTVTDTYGFESTDTQSIEILNATPIANADAYSTNEDTLLNSDFSVLNNDNDPNNDELTVVNTGVSTMIGMGGSINISVNGTFVYTPVADVSGTDELSYLVTDGTSTVAATITITVNPVNDAPTFTVMGDVDVTGLVDVIDDFVEIPDFIENIVFGPTDENGQSIDSITAVDIDPDHVINSVTIDNNGLLRIDINIGNYGAAIVQVQLKDDGGTANGGEDTSQIVEFMVIYDDLVFGHGFEANTRSFND